MRWLKATPQLDITSTKLRTRMMALTQLLATPREKAVAIHDFVKSLPFGCSADYSPLKASDVLKLGHGDCFTKGMLMVALLRCAGIPARLRFMSLPVHFLRGIIDAEESTIVHAMAEVFLEDRWIVTDSYVPDEALQLAANARLVHENRSMGYGVHIHGSLYWTGKDDASAQCDEKDPSSLPTVDWGVADDPNSFYDHPSHSELRRNFATRLKWRLAAPVVNKRVAAIRMAHA
ncbi:transglutaminase-like domain-containing protein [Variovorax sp. PCZ-1]|uniref:transglutaminase-like domain-containing protein n=1 Tax=Variovorax sp. PCZ-1 TaxID=2835533 RepID=UPI001BCC6B92|nr:transglutaminase-like domain-containing protein [Variovorax sp. PCZ-1]MBS7808012.1 transglutaminase domain-containing protein [Variovorax sp. PCZ-1]